MAVDFMEKKLSRLLSLIQFAQESALLKIRPRSDVEGYLFCDYENNIRQLPGVHLNSGALEDEIWLTVERLNEIAPPKPKDQQLSLWLEISDKPNKDPSLRKAIESSKDADSLNQKEILLLEDFNQKSELEALFAAYVENEWRPWAEEEKLRIRSAQLYSQLFRIKQHLEGSIVASEIEFVWGIGMVVWNRQGTHIRHPLSSLSSRCSQCSC